MKRLLLFLFIILGYGWVHAQNEEEQLLIFRNTGEVNLLYSNEVDSIVCSCLDGDSLLHDDFVSQIFYAKDTTLVVPIAEIDSVAFGHRNVTKYKENVRQLIATDLCYIIRYDETAIYYRSDTPSGILPFVGQKLFYGEMDDTFPIGLCAKVTAVEKTAENIKVSVLEVELGDVFEELFFAGRVYPEAVTISRAGNGARSTHALEFPCKLEMGDLGNINISGRVTVSADFVVQPLKHYYHASIVMDTDVGFDVDLAIDKAEYSYENEIKTFHFPNIATVLHPQLTIGAFSEINAELSFNYSMRRNYHQAWEWTRKGDVNSFVNLAGNDTGTPENKARIDVTCKGNLYFGPQFIFELNTLLSAVGVRFKTKLGPEVESEVGMGLILSLSEEYSPDLYAKAELNIATKLGLSGHTFTRNLFTDEENVYEFFSLSNKWGNRTFSLFPAFEETRAVEMQRVKGNVALSVATKSGNEIIRDVETGFEIVNEETKEVVDSSFVKTIVAEKNEMQGVAENFTIPASIYDPDKLALRPVFHYAGHTIRAAKANILTDVHIQPLVGLITNGMNTVVLGYPMIGSMVLDSTYYNIGNYMPVNIGDTVFVSPSSITTGIFITLDEETSLIGTWSGDLNGKRTVLSFSNDGTGTYKQGELKTFKYQLNYPQSGDIVLYMDDETSQVYILYSLIDSELILKPKKQNVYYTFTKQ